MTDLAAFAEEGFDPKAWINEACAGKSNCPADTSSLLRCRLQFQASQAGASQMVHICSLQISQPSR
jgi:hypothetical protein